MVTSAPQSTQFPCEEDTFTTTPVIQPEPQRLNSSLTLPACPLDQLTSASAPPSFSLSKTNVEEDERQYARVSSENLHLSLLKTALDSFFDSILVIHPDGQILQANAQANELFADAVPETLWPQASPTRSHFKTTDSPISQPLQPLLNEIWRVTIAMRDSQSEFPNQDIILDSEVAWDSEAFRIRVRWMDLVILQQPCLLVTIEDLQQTAVNQINVDRWKYKLTPREVDVWGLKRQGYSYKAIASTLFVSENTVKKHLKNIQVKRRDKDGPAL